ncbi:MAG TPA: hypothetical protein VK454_11605, partial [Myxococcaceae bacterium]|nr:hypothetical protein [Myxococcaceae bacterium]
LTGLGRKAARAKGVEAALLGKPADAASLGAAAEKATEGLQLRADAQLPEPYRRSLAVTYTRRALLAAAKRATG